MISADDAALASDVADIRALVAELAAEAIGIANALESLDCFSEVIRLTRRMGYAEGRAEWDDHAATARARERRAQFRVIPGGKSPKVRRAPVKRPARKTPDGTA